MPGSGNSWDIIHRKINIRRKDADFLSGADSHAGDWVKSAKACLWRGSKLHEFLPGRRSTRNYRDRGWADKTEVKRSGSDTAAVRLHTSARIGVEVKLAGKLCCIRQTSHITLEFCETMVLS